MFLKLICVLSVVGFAACRTLPSFVKPCKRSDPELEKCLLNFVEDLRIRLPKGIPEMKIPPIDPLQLPEIKLNHGNSKSVNFKASFKNLVAEGSKDFTLRKINIDWKTPKIVLEALIPKMNVLSDYDIDGKILVMPISGKGKWTGTFNNIVAHVTLNGEFLKKDGKTYMAIKDRQINLKVGGTKMNFSNLFNGNKELGETTNRFINENWRDIVTEVRPLIEDTVGEIMVQMSKGLLETYSLEDLLPES